MGNNLTLDREKTIWMLLRQTGNIIYSLIEDELRLSDKVSYERATVLFMVKKLGQRAICAEIARWMVREPHTISALLDRMEENGLIRRVKDLERKNQARIELTDKGEEALSKAFDIKVIGEVMSSLSDEQQESLLVNLSNLKGKAIDKYLARRRRAMPVGFQLPEDEEAMAAINAQV